jgi:hypothetical protein
MLARNAAKRQFEHVEVARGRPQNGVFLYFPYAGVQTCGDPACDLALHLRNIRRIAGEAVSPSNAAVAGVDKLHVNDERAVEALSGAFDEIAGAKLLAYDPGRKTLTRLANNFPSQTEGLDMRPDGRLVSLTDGAQPISLFTLAGTNRGEGKTAWIACEFVPTPLRDCCSGAAKLSMSAANMRAVLTELEAMKTPETDSSITDDRLQLIFTCCHPALTPDAQIALTLREICGLTTEEIAQAFLTPAPTLAQRIVRHRCKPLHRGRIRSIMAT